MLLNTIRFLNNHIHQSTNNNYNQTYGFSKIWGSMEATEAQRQGPGGGGHLTPSWVACAAGKKITRLLLVQTTWEIWGK